MEGIAWLADHHDGGGRAAERVDGALGNVNN